MTTLIEVSERALGRVYVPDPRDRKFLARDEAAVRRLILSDDDTDRSYLTPSADRALSPTGPGATPQSVAGKLLRTRPWKTGPTLNQRAFPHCVAFAWLQFLMTAPIMRGPKDMTPITASKKIHFADAEIQRWTRLSYDWMQRNDEWPGTEYDGTSVRAGADYLLKHHEIDRYVWAWDIPTAKAFVRSNEGGPLVAGMDWFTGMDTLRKGYAEPTGHWRGGHAFLVYWYSERLNAWRCKNSWGPTWGEGIDGGDFWIHNDGFQYLLESLNGELCAAIQKPKS